MQYVAAAHFRPHIPSMKRSSSLWLEQPIPMVCRSWHAMPRLQTRYGEHTKIKSRVVHLKPRLAYVQFYNTYVGFFTRKFVDVSKCLQYTCAHWLCNGCSRSQYVDRSGGVSIHVWRIRDPPGHVSGCLTILSRRLGFRRTTIRFFFESASKTPLMIATSPVIAFEGQMYMNTFHPTN